MFRLGGQDFFFEEEKKLISKGGVRDVCIRDSKAGAGIYRNNVGGIQTDITGSGSFKRTQLISSTTSSILRHHFTASLTIF